VALGYPSARKSWELQGPAPFDGRIDMPAAEVTLRASGIFGRPPGFPDRPFRKAMSFTSSHGFYGVRLRTRALQGSARIGIFQVAGNKSFFRQRSVYEALEKQARNKGVSSQYQAPDGGGDGFSRLQ